MVKRRWTRVGITFTALVLVASACGGSDDTTIDVGLNIEITGETPKIGEHSRVAAEMFVEEFNAAGGIELAGTVYTLRLVVEDNLRTAEGAVAATNKLATQDRVHVQVGPNPSAAAVPAGEVANNLETPMISPWSTNEHLTLDRPWVFRAAFLDPFQGPVVANFATDELGASTACVLFDVAEDYPVGIAEQFRTTFESLNGAGSVVAYESFTTGDVDFSAQLTNIGASGCDVLFAPQYYNQVPDIVQQAQALGLDMPILGSDSWGDPQLLELCGDACEGFFFSTHYVASGATGATREFIDKFIERHPTDDVPSDVGALTWDSMLLLAEALRICGEITGDLEDDRDCIRDGFASISDFDGITGRMTFEGTTGDPIKCAVIVQIQDGDLVYHSSVCP